MKNKKRFLVILLLCVIVLKAFTVFQKAPIPETDHAKLRKIWLHSQYNLDQGYEFYGNMSDEDLRTFAALEYIQGKDPSIVNFEDPPLIKYILGISYLLLGNILFVQYAAGYIVLFLTYLLAKRLSIPAVFSIFPALILVVDPLFLERSTSVNLDLIQLLFVLMALLILTKKQISSKSLLFLGIFVGAVMASKVVVIGLALLFFSLVVLYLNSKLESLKTLLLFLLASFGTYIISYSLFFVYHSPLEFLSLHEKIFRLYRSYLPEYPWFEIWRILLLGKWRTWFKTPAIQPVAEYWIAWPLSTVASFSLFFNKNNRRLPLFPQMIFLGWVLVYLLFQSTHVVFPRYLLLVLPLLYVLSIFFLTVFLKKFFLNLRFIRKVMK